MNTVDILRKGKAVLLERGWTQGTYVEYTNRGNGPCCVLGACLIGADLNPLNDEEDIDAIGDVENEVERAIREANHFDFAFTAAGWNDHPGRTKGEIIAALDKAIAYRAGLDELP